MTDPFATQIIFATMAEPQSGEAQLAGVRGGPMRCTEQIIAASAPSGRSREAQLVGVGPHEKTRQ